MKVSSPVGEFPYTIEGATIERGRIILRGRMGAWPSAIEMKPRDLAQVAGLVAFALLLASAGALRARAAARGRAVRAWQES